MYLLCLSVLILLVTHVESVVHSENPLFGIEILQIIGITIGCVLLLIGVISIVSRICIHRQNIDTTDEIV